MSDKHATSSAVLVEDDEDTAQLLEFMLVREGFIVHMARDGREALSLIDSVKPPTIVLLDIMLPFISGFQLLQHIRKKTKWADTPIIMLTSKRDESVIVRAMESGASDYVIKPFNWGELIARIKRFLK